MEELYNSDVDNAFHRFDPSNRIHETAIIYGNVSMGKDNVIGPYTVIGSNGEIRGAKEFNGTVDIGNGNIISEHVTIQRPATETKTVIGNNNIIMAHAHIGHDAKIGNNTEICTTTVIGGYAEVRDGARVKLHCVIRNRKIIGERATVGMGSVVVNDVNADEVVVGNPAKPLNK